MHSPRPPRLRLCLLRCALLLLCLLIGTLTPRATRAIAPFVTAPCPIAAPQGIHMDCGVLTVPESRSAFTGKTIRLPVAILRSPNPNKAPDPVVFLQGGPGAATIVLAPILVSAYHPILAERDIILMDQRGTGFAEPRLDCAGISSSSSRAGLRAQLRSADLSDELHRQAELLAQCGQSLRAAGVDLRAYNSAESAADYEDLRLALGYKPWNVIGGSYGTHLALSMVRFRPETLRSVVLDSIDPFQVNFQVDVFRSYNRTLSLLAAECAAEHACRRAYPNLLSTFDKLYVDLNTNPAQVPVIDPQTGRTITYVPLTGVAFSNIVFQLFYATDLIPMLPLLIGETAKGNYAPFGSILGVLFAAQPAQTSGAAEAVGMLTAVQCNEDVTFATQKDFIAARHHNQRARSLSFLLFFNERVLKGCEGFGLNNPDPLENQAVRSDRPILILSGTNDPITPPEYATIGASTLSNSFIVTYPRGGHAPSFSSLCLATAVATFLNTPNQHPNTSCIAQETPRPFLTPSTASPQRLTHTLSRFSRTLPLYFQ